MSEPDIDVLRLKGVKSFSRSSDGGWSVEFFPSAPTEPPTKTEAPAPDPELCRCGHSYHQHIDGLCGIGCDVEACAPKEA